MWRSLFAKLFLAACAVSWAVQHAQAQPPTADVDVAPSLSIELIQARLQAAESTTDLDPNQRARIVDAYKQILAELERKKTLEAANAQLVGKINAVPQDIAEAKAAIAALAKEAVIDPYVAKTLEKIRSSQSTANQDIDAWLTLASDALKQLDAKVSEQRLELEETKKVLSGLKDEPTRRANRRVSIPQETAAANDRIQALEKEAGQPSPADEPTELTEARRLLTEVRLKIANLELESNKKELQRYEAAEELLPLRIELAQRRVALLEQSVKLWGETADRLRNRINEQQKISDASKVRTVASELSTLADENLKLSKQRSDLLANIKEARRKLEETTQDLDFWDEKFENVQRQIGDRTSVTEAIGELLRTDRNNLPNVRRLRAASKLHKNTLYDVRSNETGVQVLLWDFNDFDAKVEKELRKLPQTVSAERRETLEPDVIELLKSQKTSLELLKTDLSANLDILTKLVVQEDDLIILTQEYSNFVDARVLWIRSMPPIRDDDLSESLLDATLLLSLEEWATFGRMLWDGIKEQWMRNVVAVFVLVTLIGYRLRYRHRIRELGEQAESRTCRDFGITLGVATYSVIRAGTWPAVFGWLAWNVSKLPDSAQSVTIALQAVAWFSFPLMLWQRIVRPNSLAESHFDWSEHNLKVLRRTLRWFVPILLSSVALFHLFNTTNDLAADESAGRLYLFVAIGADESLGRLCLLVATGAMAFFLQRLASPQSGLLREYIGTNRGGWCDRLSFLWYPILVGIPIAFAALSLLGYQYTATQLFRRFYLSIAFLSGMYLASAMFLRWLTLKRRSLAIEQARERLAALAIAGDSEQPQADSVGGVTITDNIDLSTVNLQSQRMLNTFSIAAALLGLYLIWVGVLPALERLDEVELWSTAELRQVSAVPTRTETTEAAAQPASSTYPPTTDEDSVTLGNLITALIVLILTIVATQNIPGFMEIALLQRLPLDASVRFAITTLTRYVIVLVGTAMAFGNIGIGWAKIQWLVAAISVGLGFGLQEIFANFISGLILLFERPLRAGDIVTVGDVTGRVVQIKTRATMIQDWDRKELIVPNKEFITGRVLNWTLSDTVNRIVIPIGIAYGSNLKEARRILLKIADDHELIVDDPCPSVTFELFGDSTLNFTLRCFLLLANMDKRLSIVHDLHEAIHDQLHEAGIEIAFPQRDLHIRSVDVPFAVNNQTNGKPTPNGQDPSESASAPKKKAATTESHGS